jgi:trehalose/maltose hydrolase-like predicted phosphorylase
VSVGLVVLSRSEEVVPVDGFAFTYEGFDPAGEGLREALTSTGNGFLCARGAAEWEDADGVHYPGTYAHGVYNGRRWSSAFERRPDPGPQQQAQD